ncbi:hypothetical protein C7U54_06150 [Faecalibacillus intestinalis]|uniref:Uncharacterized protein n=1 Tax=Faecalibacillus intestinalis TaxID=1982626 RepID=A0A2T3G2Z4_9FIRM|nr:hypothetical protein [Faecalibacillus intestinalis]PST41916.1 hypothetical protein C7U54_06150 [Faecalibacillus intestinalis]RGG81762.1 hypothetical protein DWW80_08570 [Coprobacillus sp. AF17-17AC]RGG85637.1 hypothetical protein DWW76_08375 [Coprobacillus sp. AF17-11AC]
MDILKERYIKQLDTRFNEILKYKNLHSDFWCGYSLAMFHTEITEAFNKGFLTKEESNYLCRCGSYASIIL